MKFRLAIALLPLALAACDEQAMQDIRLPWDRPLDATPATGDAAAAAEAAPAADAPLVAPAVSPTDVPIEAEGTRTRVATAKSETLNTMAFTARGNEPFWRVDIANGVAQYKTPENQSGRNIPVNRIVYRYGVEYIGVLNGQPFSVKINSSDCADTMSGERFPMTASLRAGATRANGCAGPAEPAASASDTVSSEQRPPSRG